MAMGRRHIDITVHNTFYFFCGIFATLLQKASLEKAYRLRKDDHCYRLNQLRLHSCESCTYYQRCFVTTVYVHSLLKRLYYKKL
jgi:hypothetical protein